MSTSEKRKKTGLVMVRAAPEELALLRTCAAEVGLPASAYLLASGLCQQTRSKSSAHLIEELRRLGMQQKALWTANGGALTPEYRAILVEILAAIDRIGV